MLDYEKQWIHFVRRLFMIIVEEYFFLNLTVSFYFYYPYWGTKQLNYRIEPLGKDRAFLFIIRELCSKRREFLK